VIGGRRSPRTAVECSDGSTQELSRFERAHRAWAVSQVSAGEPQVVEPVDDSVEQYADRSESFVITGLVIPAAAIDAYERRRRKQLCHGG